MGDLATVQQLAERVSQMGYPPSRIILDWSSHDRLTRLELETLEEFFTACFDAREELRGAIGGYTEEDLDRAYADGHSEGYSDGYASANDEAQDAAYDRGYEAGRRALWTSTRDED